VIKGSIARRYAKALIQLAQEEDKIGLFGEELGSMARLLEEVPELFNSLRNPAVPKEKRREIMEAVLDQAQPHPYMRNFMLLVLDRRRIEHLPGMASSYLDYADELEGKVRARVTSAMPLDSEKVENIKATLQDRIGKTVVLETGANPGLIAGLVAQVGNYLFDYSLYNQLQKVRKELIAGR